MQTLEIARILEKRDFKQEKAFRLAEAINGKSGLATKEDIAKIEALLNTKASKEDLLKLENMIAEKTSKSENMIAEKMSKSAERMSNLEISNKWIISIMLLFGSALVSGMVAILIKLYIP